MQLIVLTWIVQWRLDTENDLRLARHELISAQPPVVSFDLVIRCADKGATVAEH